MGIVQRLRAECLFSVRIVRTLARIIPLAYKRTRTLPVFVEELAARHGERPAFVSRDEALTYAGYNAYANRYARWTIAGGVKKGETVCLLMPNRPMFLAIWLGIGRAGGVTALLNTNLAGKALAHCINIVRPRHIIVAAELAETFDTAAPLIEPGVTVWWHGGERAGAADRIDEAVMAFDDGPLSAEERPALSHDDRFLYIYTSGTTGMPKAANINHYRVIAAMIAFSTVMGARASDKMYDCLPLYHTVGGVIAAGACLRAGGSVFIAEKFSARHFWDDVVDNDCTLFQYIGELCRYLVNAPPHPKEGRHHIRLVCGNGLRPDIWETFQQRFNIRRVREFYAATEGNAIMFNLDGTAGAIGRCPFWLRPLFPMINIRLRQELDHETVVRGPDGFCVKCAPGEVGELISEIAFDPMKPGQRFDGYADRAATEAKILHDVFRKGDMWFRSADLVRRDRNGYFYFVDRIGDTFRWKGENVSTAEVAEMIDTFEGVQEASVYGVKIEDMEGKAGMAAIVAADGFDRERLRAHIHAKLAPYARPLFVRMQETIDATSTFKQRKINLTREGFDPEAVSDRIFFDDPRAGRYVLLDADLYRQIQSGKLRL
jgi:fatty-acyl-CoA synthase